jgi:hypothetical protein
VIIGGALTMGGLVMRQQDLRTPAEKFGDFLADDFSMDEIGARLNWSPLQLRQRYLAICRELGVKPDEE